jgi:methyltransferase (TIGR00027 family)
MGAAKRSRTAQGVLAERALLTDMGVLDDPYAHRMLAPSMAAVFGFVRHWPYRVRARSVTLAGLATRVLWIDAQVTSALDAGTTQVAVIGAGYDSRAWRLARDGVQFFELDHGATQKDKKQRAPGPGPTYVEADLTTQSAAETLLEHGLDASRPTFFVLEGVTMYLTEEIVRRQLGDLRSSSGAGSRFAADFAPARDAGTTTHRRQNRLQRMARAGSGEGLMLALDRPGAVALVEASGWRVEEQTGLREAARALVPPGSGLPIDAVNDHKSMLAAVRS